jgi:hypothetical protein
MFVWSGSAWAEISSSADIISYKYTVSGGATSVTGADDNGLTLSYTVGKEQVYINGVLQVRGSDYVATTGSSITGIPAMLASDIVTVLAFTSFVVSDTYTQAQADAKFFQNANAFVAGKNKIINGDFRFNQRNFTSTTTSGEYGFDRFTTFFSDGTSTYSAQTFTLGAAPVAGYEGTNFARIASTGQTLTSAATWLRHKMESVRTFAGQTVTVSFWAKAASGTPKVAVELSQIFGNDGSPSATVNTYAGQATLSTSWQRFTLSVAVPSISGKTLGTRGNDTLVLNLFTSAGTDYNSRSGSLGIQTTTIDFWGVQVEAGSIATPFQTATGTIQGELAACQRYYWRIPASASATYQVFSNSGWYASTTQFEAVHRMPVSMRVAPTTLDFAATLQVLDTAGTGITTSSGSISAAESNPDTVRVNWAVTGATAGRFGNVRAPGSATAYVGFGAEL